MAVLSFAAGGSSDPTETCRGSTCVANESERSGAPDELAFAVGQLAGPGTYTCERCGHAFAEYALSFEVEPCAKCGGVLFRRTD